MKMTLHRWTWLFCFLLLWAPVHAFYNPTTGRWLSRDPIGEKDLANVYCFVGNNPILIFDRNGKERGMVICPGCNRGFMLSDGAPFKCPYCGWPPRPPQYPQGFSLCQRDLQKDSSCDCVTGIGNLLGGEHSYLQYVDSEGNKWGWGFISGGTVSEGAFKPNNCKPCKKTGMLKAGSGVGKSTSSASDAEIQDCIKNSKPTRPYSTLKYNCRDWAKEAAKNCGLDCN